MKRKEKESLRANTVEELKKKLAELNDTLAGIARQRYTRQSRNVKEGKMVRNQIARVKTLIHEKELSI